MKIKLFRFRVSNWTLSILSGDHPSDDAYLEVVSLDEIEECINEFASLHEVVDIKVNNIDVKYHNNARGNTIDFIYTIIYK